MVAEVILASLLCMYLSYCVNSVFFLLGLIARQRNINIMVVQVRCDDGWMGQQPLNFLYV